MNQLNDQIFLDVPSFDLGDIRLRQQNEKDAAYIFRLRSNETVNRYLDQYLFTSIERAEEFLRQNLDKFAKKEGLFWVIEDLASGQVIGDFTLWDIDRKDLRAELGHTLHPDFWGKGIMTKVAHTIIPFAFNDLGIHSLKADINPNNDSSRKLLLKLGFKKEAYFRESYHYNNQFLDTEVYGLLQGDYQKI